MYPMTSGGEQERGASLITVAITMVLLMGMAAIAIDLGLGFNERRQDQTAADVAVMAGATESVLGSDQQTIVSETLQFARLNLDTSFGDAEWEAIWEECEDPDKDSFDVGTGTPVEFQPMSNLTAWAADGPAELDCISQVSSYFRVRVPDQLVNTSFAQVLGFSDLTTSAAAVARIEPGGSSGAVYPFGIPGNTGTGEICLKSSGSGTAFPPCQGSSSGGFGEIDSEFFGDLFGTPDCGLPGATELAQNVALGMDHAVSVWPETDAADESVTVGSPHPGDNVVRNYQNIGYDACRIVDGNVEPEFAGHVTPPNTMRVATGFSPDPIEEGLVSNSTFLGEPSKLQQGSNPTRDIVKRRTGATEEIYKLDNVGLWDYLNDMNAVPTVPECDGETYGGLPIEDKVDRMHTCLANYPSTETTDLFVDDIEDSPRLVWAPEYWHAAATSGKSWQPIKGFRLVFIGGTYFNCSGSSCGVVFYPDLEGVGEMCDPGASGCKALGLDQLSGFLLPFEAIPDDSIPPFPGAETAFTATLFK